MQRYSTPDWPGLPHELEPYTCTDTSILYIPNMMTGLSNSLSNFTTDPFDFKL